MTRKRDLDIEAVKKLRAAGNSWEQTASALGWNCAALRDRLRRDGYYEEAGSPASSGEPLIDDGDGVPIDWQKVADLLKAGCPEQDVSSFFGLSFDYLQERYGRSPFRRFSDFPRFLAHCRALGRCELKQALFNLAKSGDKNALVNWQNEVKN